MLLMKLTGVRGEPFQFTARPFTKSVPVTVRVKPWELQNGVEGIPVVDAESEVIVGATIKNDNVDVPPKVHPKVPEVHPIGSEVETVTGTGTAGTAERSEAETGMFRCVGSTYVVALAAPFHSTTEQGTKLVPVTTSVKFELDPAVARDGLSEAAASAGRLAGAATVKFTGLELAEKLVTVIGTVAGDATFRNEMMAVRYGAPEAGVTSVVGRGEPFQLTTEPFMKFVPITVSVKLAGLQAGVEADEVVDADKDVIVGVGGWLIVNKFG